MFSTQRSTWNVSSESCGSNDVLCGSGAGDLARCGDLVRRGETLGDLVLWMGSGDLVRMGEAGVSRGDFVETTTLLTGDLAGVVGAEADLDCRFAAFDGDDGGAVVRMVTRAGLARGAGSSTGELGKFETVLEACPVRGVVGSERATDFIDVARWDSFQGHLVRFTPLVFFWSHLCRHYFHHAASSTGTGGASTCL